MVSASLRLSISPCMPLATFRRALRISKAVACLAFLSCVSVLPSLIVLSSRERSISIFA